MLQNISYFFKNRMNEWGSKSDENSFFEELHTWLCSVFFKLLYLTWYISVKLTTLQNCLSIRFYATSAEQQQLWWTVAIKARLPANAKMYQDSSTSKQELSQPRHSVKQAAQQF